MTTNVLFSSERRTDGPIDVNLRLYIYFRLSDQTFIITYIIPFPILGDCYSKVN